MTNRWKHGGVAAIAALLAVPAWAAADPSPPADEIVVTGSAYRGEVASGGARIDADVRDLPLSIDVLTQALIEDRQVRNLRDLADNVAGVRSRASGSGAFTIGFTIRGLQDASGADVAVNGFRVANFSAGFDPAAVDRVEFLKGPASVLYGASGALSGLVNIVTKVPEKGDFLTLEGVGGAPAYGRFTLDGNVALTGTLSARTNVAITHDTVLDAFRRVDEQFVDQTLRWQPVPAVTILGEGYYFHSLQPSREATTYPSLTRFLDFPTDFKLGEAWDRNEHTGFGARLDATWTVAPGLTLREGVNYQNDREGDYDSAFYPYDGDLFLSPTLLSRSVRRGLGTTNVVASQTEARYDVDLGPTTHKLLAGFEYSRQNVGGSCCDGAPVAPLDLADPVYGAPRPVVGLTQFFRNTIETKAVYLQDFVSFHRFRVLLGVRYDDTTSTSAFCDLTLPGCPGDPVVASLGVAPKSAVSPRAGLAWQPGDRTTLFVSWSRSFNPNVELDRDNHLLPPERGEQFEGGIRQDLAPDHRLTVSASIFQLTRQNIAEDDPAFPDGSRSVAVGEQRIRGAEVELAGKPVPWLDLIATYSYLDGVVTRSDVATTGIAVGSRLPETAPNSASVFAKVALTPLGADNVAVSAGVYFVDRRPTRDFFGNFFAGPYATALSTLPASTRLDLGAYWDVTARLRLQANITNVFDTPVYEPVNLGFARSLTRRGTVGARVSF